MLSLWCISTQISTFYSNSNQLILGNILKMCLSTSVSFMHHSSSYPALVAGSFVQMDYAAFTSSQCLSLYECQVTLLAAEIRLCSFVGMNDNLTVCVRATLHVCYFKAAGSQMLTEVQ